MLCLDTMGHGCSIFIHLSLAHGEHVEFLFKLDLSIQRKWYDQKLEIVVLTLSLRSKNLAIYSGVSTDFSSLTIWFVAPISTRSIFLVSMSVAKSLH